MTIEQDIQDALCAQLKTPDLTDPATSIAWPLVTFVPTPNVAYVDVHAILRAAPRRNGIGFNSSVIRRGIFQIDAVVPDGAGEAPGLVLAGLIAARFPIGLVLTAGGRRLQLLKEPTIAAAVSDAPWIRFPVSIPYQLIGA